MKNMSILQLKKIPGNDEFYYTFKEEWTQNFATKLFLWCQY